MEPKLISYEYDEEKIFLYAKMSFKNLYPVQIQPIFGTLSFYVYFEGEKILKCSFPKLFLQPAPHTTKPFPILLQGFVDTAENISKLLERIREGKPVDVILKEFHWQTTHPDLVWLQSIIENLTLPLQMPARGIVTELSSQLELLFQHVLKQKK